MHATMFSPVAWSVAIAAFAAGLALGTLHFLALRRVANAVVDGALAAALLLQGARLAVLGTALFGLALAGPVPLLAALAGVIVARRIVLRRTDPAYR